MLVLLTSLTFERHTVTEDNRFITVAVPVAVIVITAFVVGVSSQP